MPRGSNGRLKRKKNGQRRERSIREGRGDVVIGRRLSRLHRAELRSLIAKHRGYCALCGEAVTLKSGDPRRATRDHIVPLSKGGLDTIENMQLACFDCNQKKGASLPDTD